MICDKVSSTWMIMFFRRMLPKLYYCIQWFVVFLMSIIVVLFHQDNSTHIEWCPILLRKKWNSSALFHCYAWFQCSYTTEVTFSDWHWLTWLIWSAALFTRRMICCDAFFTFKLSAICSTVVLLLAHTC